MSQLKNPEFRIQNPEGMTGLLPPIEVWEVSPESSHIAIYQARKALKSLYDPDKKA